ncbi:phosphoribosylamine--glycine ligase [Clostridium acetireducens DSM 10703]|jgi:phosphoribosylamine--glycine ligase|uniref:Phosphoribosylamine--glycine ligase n=1 Tax=Clostridium acetireducens DSM 10703 TaxID=1121290 RepID=A0A1E8EZH2_9CLOT|nr:phosphoribosylamine--glycine ligase [Clostridium acetireducens]OFI06285.1 phosphoribosylamine--glycine ligase [Clostridium acetireducens DSM 10703]
MKIMIIGSGGREHAILWKVAQNPKVEKVYCAPGNGCTELEEKCENINISDLDELAKFAKENSVDLTIVGPEVPLVEGIVDKFREKGLRIFGPSKKAAELEGSKAYAKEFMKKYNIKTAGYEVFDDKEKALKYINACNFPVVIKADGLAAGKGVVICESYEQAEETLEDFMIKDRFNGSGKTIVVEEFLKGIEASILAITDGKTIIPFISAKDHKQIFDGNKGPNTGGMGSIAPNPYCTKRVLREFDKDILQPTLKGIQEENLDFKGIVFFGIMINRFGTYLLEYNVRLGDPETQAVLPLMESDLVELIEAALDEKLSDYTIKWKKGFSCCVVAASKGYPGKYETGFEIQGVNKAKNVFGAGVKLEEGTLKTAGGRVLCAWAAEDSLIEATKKAYMRLDEISFDGIYYRTDIGNI